MTDTPDIEIAANPPHEPPKGAIAIIFLIVLVDLMGFGIIIPSLPLYAKLYKASYFQIGLLFSIFSACQLIATPVLGLLSDRYGRRPVLVLSQLGSVAGYLLLGFATHHQWQKPALALGMIYLSRVIDGISGGNISTAQAYISDVTSKENRAKAMGVLGAAFGIGFSLGPALGGFLGRYNLGYPAFAAALFSFLAAAQTFWRLPEPARHKPAEESEVWLHPAQFLPILRSSVVVEMLLISFLSMIAFAMLESIFAIFLNDRYGYGQQQVSYFFAFVGVVIVIVQGGLLGRLNKRFGEWTLSITGPLLIAVAMCVYVEAGWHRLIWLLLLAGFLNATGRSLQTPTLSSLISHRTDPKQQGTTFGLYHGLGSLARVFGPLIATSVYMGSRHWPPFAIAGVIMVVVMVWTVTLRLRTEAAPSPVTVSA